MLFGSRGKPFGGFHIAQFISQAVHGFGAIETDGCLLRLRGACQPKRIDGRRVARCKAGGEHLHFIWPSAFSEGERDLCASHAAVFIPNSVLQR